jgi:pyruvate kinase
VVEQGATVLITCDSSVKSCAQCLAISYDSFEGTGIAPGSAIFVGQYLYSGSDSTSIYFTVKEVRPGYFTSLKYWIPVQSTVLKY